MSKMFYRTVTVFTYPAVKLTMEEGKVKSEIVGQISNDCKLTLKALQKRAAKLWPNVDVSFLHPTVETCQYEMSLKDFIKYATKRNTVEEETK